MAHEVAGEHSARAEIMSHTGMRGIAAVCVVLYHYRINLESTFDVDRFTLFFASADAFVDAFFILSGFILAANYHTDFRDRITAGSVGRYLLRRFARIYPLHLVTLVISVCLTVTWMNGGTTTSTLLVDVLENLLLVHAWGMNEQYVFNFPSWSVSAEWFLYLTFPFLIYGMAKPGVRGGILVGTVLLYVSLFVWGNGLNLDERLSLWRAVPAFAFGLLIQRYSGLERRVPARVLSVLQLGCVLALAVLMHSGRLEWLIVPVFGLLVLLTCRDRGAVSRASSIGIFTFLGVISYAIYMLHVPVRSAMYIVQGKVFPDLTGPVEDVTFVGLCIAATLLAGTISYFTFERDVRNWIVGKERRLWPVRTGPTVHPRMDRVS